MMMMMMMMMMIIIIMVIMPLLLLSGRGVEYYDQLVCVSVCPQAYLWNL